MDEKLLENEITEESASEESAVTAAYDEENEGVIITIDDNYVGPSSEEAEKQILDEINARESNIEEYTPPKLGFFKWIENFWYRNKTLILVAAFGIFILVYFTIISLPEECDITATVYVSFSDYPSSITHELQNELKSHTSDWDENGEINVFVNDFNIYGEGGAETLIQYDQTLEHLNGKPTSMLWIVEKDLFDVMVSAKGEEFFESYEGAPLWMEITHMEILNECIKIGESPRLGFCLVRMTEELSEKEKLCKSYENAKLLLAEYKKLYPEMFASAAE